MTGALIAGGASIAVGDLWLIAISWRHRAVLAGMLGAAGIPFVVFAIASGATTPSRWSRATADRRVPATAGARPRGHRCSPTQPRAAPEDSPERSASSVDATAPGR